MSGLDWALPNYSPPLLPLLLFPQPPTLISVLVFSVLNMHPTYCGLCDMWFSSQRSFDTHLVLNDRHPSCKKCDRKFADKLAYLKVAYRTLPCPSRFRVERSLKRTTEPTASGAITKASLLFALRDRSQQRFGTQSGKAENLFARLFNHFGLLITAPPIAACRTCGGARELATGPRGRRGMD